jgi:hypothetical protein
MADPDEPEFDWEGEPYARRTDPVTSHISADRMDGDRLSHLKRKTVEAAREMGDYGMINDDLVRITGEEWNAITPRVKPLLDAGILTIRYDANFEIMQRMGSKRRPQRIVWLVKGDTNG